jgi:HD domain
MDLTSQARRYATEAHSRINHRRKYSLVPYDVHLKNVADIVASVTDDQEMIAAAWLHDVVEDTPASFLDLEKEFGMGVADMVSEVTDVSRSSDGNRATRKALDRAHLACASRRGKTLKLADLIDNCQDICRNDAVFAKTYLTEMASLLEVLVEGDAELYQRAVTMMQENAQSLGLHLTVVSGLARENPPATASLAPLKRMSALFLKTFAARDLARVLPSIDLPLSESSAAVLTQSSHGVLGLRRHGLIEGYVLREDPRCERQFRKSQIVGDDANFAEVILALSQHNYCFVRMLGSVVGVILRSDIDHPYMRMWLFGIITMAEMQIMPAIDQLWQGESWKELISPGRLAKAEAVLEERQRRNQQSTLLACLQLSDKLQLLLENENVRKALGFSSKKMAHKVCKEFESLRNNLAHAQDIVSHDFGQIARLAQRIDAMSGA